MIQIIINCYDLPLAFLKFHQTSYEPTTNKKTAVAHAPAVLIKSILLQ